MSCGLLIARTPYVVELSCAGQVRLGTEFMEIPLQGFLPSPARDSLRVLGDTLII